MNGAVTGTVNSATVRHQPTRKRPERFAITDVAREISIRPPTAPRARGGFQCEVFGCFSGSDGSLDLPFELWRFVRPFRTGWPSAPRFLCAFLCAMGEILGAIPMPVPLSASVGGTIAAAACHGSGPFVVSRTAAGVLADGAVELIGFCVSRKDRSDVWMSQTLLPDVRTWFG